MSFSDDDDISSTGSYSSDDEYHFTTGMNNKKVTGDKNKNTNNVHEQDREAIVRKKLLESFYGTSMVPQNQQEQKDAPSTKKLLEKEEEDELSSMKQLQEKKKNEGDLDSSDFVAETYTQNCIQTKSVQGLLETDESLAMDIRYLDSTMQTLVYENYSKFIDATDAIRSIGQIIHTSQNSLAQLKDSMDHIQQISVKMDTKIQPVRDGVADKLRIYKLLQRLDAILKLPSTLKDYISKCQYRKAASSHITALSILKQHSTTESIKTIQVECHDILQQMITQLQHSLYYWSNTNQSTTTTSTEELSPPKSIPAILECAGTLSMLLEHDDFSDIIQLTKEDCPTLALKSSHRYLERNLLFQDTVHTVTDDKNETSLLPQAFLNGILEVAALYAVTFPSWLNKIAPFLMDMFGIFMGHVRMMLLEHNKKDENDNVNDHNNDLILSQLRLSVRDFANGVQSLPKIGEQMDASTFIQQTLDLSDVMVQRKVSQQFTSLRTQVLQQCFLPFFETTTQQNSKESSSLVDMIQMANVSLLSDTLQYVEDVIHSIFQSSDDDTDVLKTAIETNCVQFAFWFASLFETISGYPQNKNNNDTFDSMVLSSKDNTNDENDNGDEEKYDDDDDEASHHSTDDLIPTIDLYHPGGNVDEKDDDDSISFFHPSQSHNNNNANEEDESEEDALWMQLSTLMEKQDTIRWTLAISELCRLAEQSVGPSIMQSLRSCTEKQTKATIQGSQFFGTSTASLKSSSPFYFKTISKRFQQAASRCLYLYILSQGNRAAELACSDYFNDNIYDDESKDDIPKEPTAWKVLQIAKTVSLECAQVFGCESMSSKVTPFPDKEDRRILVLGQQQHPNLLQSSVAMKGLQMDVERMFMDSVQIYPNVEDTMSFTRNKVVWIVLKIAFKAMMEQSRYAFFDKYTYRQIQINVDFMKHFIPHYVQSEEEGTLLNLLNTAMISIAERCINDYSMEGSTGENDDGYDSITICDEFMKHHQKLAEEGGNEEESLLEKFIITTIQE